ncbi:MAG: PDZ domain-containing protein [Fuerstiella sp.]
MQKTTEQKKTSNRTDSRGFNKLRDVVQNTQKQDDSKLKKQIVGRFLGSGNGSSQTSGGGQSGSHSDSDQDRKERLGKFFKNVVTQNLHKNHWCHSRPRTCHWWVNYCKPISHCHAHEIVECNWSRVHCSPAVHVGIHRPAVQWYLGMKGILLPGKGIGIDTVEPGSPAEAVGLQPGMVLTVCNGIALVDEAAMQEAIRISGGVLQMTLLSADGSQVLEGTVRMTQIAAVSF